MPEAAAIPTHLPDCLDQSAAYLPGFAAAPCADGTDLTLLVDGPGFRGVRLVGIALPIADN